MTFVLVTVTLLFFALTFRNSFKTRRYKHRFAKAFLEEFRHAYPDSASLLTPDLGAQVAYLIVKNRRLATELNALEGQVAKRPEIKNKSYEYFDSTYSRETQELITDLLKNKVQLAGIIFNCLPSKVRSQIDTKAESLDKTVEEVESSDEKIKKDRKKDEEKAKYLGLKTWRFSILMNIYDITSRANFAAL